MFLEIDIKNSMVLIYIMSIANVISLYCFGRETISGPNIASAENISLLEMGHFGD